jgi:hypothetical protein
MKTIATMNITIQYDNKSISPNDLKDYLQRLSKALLHTTPLVPYGWVDELIVDDVLTQVEVKDV